MVYDIYLAKDTWQVKTVDNDIAYRTWESNVFFKTALNTLRIRIKKNKILTCTFKYFKMHKIAS